VSRQPRDRELDDRNTAPALAGKADPVHPVSRLALQGHVLLRHLRRLVPPPASCAQNGPLDRRAAHSVGGMAAPVLGQG